MSVNTIVIAAASVVLLVGLYLRTRLPGRWVVTKRVSLGLSIFCGGIVLGGGLVYAIRNADQESSAASSTPPPFYGNPAWSVAGTYTGDRVAPLEAGAVFPDAPFGGWLNANPGSDSEVIVVDVWANWCLMCHHMAPRLVETYQKYGQRGVRFVGLTADSKQIANDFVERYDIPWPSRYGLRTTMSMLGAMPRLGDEPGSVTPMLYVVGADRRVRWCDNMARYKHEDLDELISALDAEIEKALREARAESSL